MKCFYCGEEVELKDSVYVPIEKPYVNLIVHKEPCFKEMEGYGEHKYLFENIDKVYNYYEYQKNLK